AGDNIKHRPQKQMSQPALGGQSSEGSDLLQSPSLSTCPPFSTPFGSLSDPSARDPEF
ncbi:hypothetical protein M9458_030374, partial [Cirrhinus mrigala]